MHCKQKKHSNLERIIMNLFEPNLTTTVWKENLNQRIEKTLWKMAVLPLNLYTGIKGQDIKGLREIHW